VTHDPGCARVWVDRADAELVADRLWFLGATAVGERAVGELVELEAGFDTVAEAAAAVDELGGELVDAGPALAAALDAWKAHARPVRVGRLHVRPRWLPGDDDPPGPGEVVVPVDPSRAFGSGSHPSTRACLAAVDRWAGPGVAVLDVGCGSGVLAHAAALLGAAPVVAVDVDAAAVEATRAAGLDVEVVLGTVHDVAGTFDLVLANIGAGNVVAAAADLAARVTPGGHLVVAGLYAARADEVGAAITGLGLVEVERVVEAGWASVIHQNPGALQHTVAVPNQPEEHE
jgi:ribosomal protein L11 methyltransferase